MYVILPYPSVRAMALGPMPIRSGRFRRQLTRFGDPGADRPLDRQWRYFRPLLKERPLSGSAAGALNDRYGGALPPLVVLRLIIAERRASLKQARPFTAKAGQSAEADRNLPPPQRPADKRHTADHHAPGRGLGHGL